MSADQMPSSADNVPSHGSSVQWPSKKREVQQGVLNSRVWDDFHFRPDDVIIATWQKSGTTWVQQIVSQLIFLGAEDVNPQDKSPWLDFILTPKKETLAKLEAQTHRRFIKTHLPLDALVYNHNAKYIYVARDGRDVVWSLHNHLVNATPEFYQRIADAPGRIGPVVQKPPADPREFFLAFLGDDSRPDRRTSTFWDNLRSWWEARHTPNLLLVNYCDLKTDMEAEIRRIALFLDIDVSSDTWPQILQHCSFEYMKANASRMSPAEAEILWEQGGETFINKGVNGRWIDLLTAEDIERYDRAAKRELGEDGAAWLASGRSTVGNA